MRIRSTIVIGSMVAVLCVAGCSKKLPTTPTGYLEGNCIGTVKDAAGSPVRGASLILVPEGYSPLSTANGSEIDSTRSDEDGRYGFTVDAPGAYNLLAKGKGLYAMRQTVRVSAEARVVLDDEILLEPGSLSGMVHLQGKSDHGGAIVLLMGTKIYTKPIDSTGVFSIAALAQGSYILRLLTVENNYVAAETTISVASGRHTEMPCIELKRRYMPVVDSLSVRYDPAMMLVTLSWTAIDTAKIKNYVVYCNRSKNLEPIAIVDKSETKSAIDIFASPIDTFQYQISAIGNDGIEGPPTLGKLFVRSSAIELDTIPCAVSFSQLDQKLCFDRKDNIFVSLGNKIIKLDSNGNYLGEFNETAIDYKSIRIDTAGNIYAVGRSVTSPASPALMKFDNDLRLVRELPLDSAQNFTIAVSASGAVMLFSTRRKEGNDAFGTCRWAYDPQFNLMYKDSIPETLFIANSVARNDTTVCELSGNSVTTHRIVYFDRSFEEILSPVDLEYRDGFYDLPASMSSSVPPGYSPIPFFYLVAKDLFTTIIIGTEISRSLLLFFDDHMQPIARVPFDLNTLGISLSLCFDCKGNLYCIPSNAKNTILKFSIAKVIGTP